MKEDYLEIKKGEKLTNALMRKFGNKNIPSNVILDKVIPGVGATYAEIHSKRKSIIIEPNVPVIKAKVLKHKDLDMLGVFKTAKVATVKAYFRKNNIEFKKILTTPEGFWKIRQAARELNINIFTDYFCLFDECEKITQDVAYRKNITQPVYDFFEFENKAFVSATPLEIKHPKISEQNFYKLKVKPNFDYKQDIEVIVTNDFANVVFERLNSRRTSASPDLFIFYNSTLGIDSIINTLRLQGYYCKTFCSPESKKKLLEYGFENVETDFKFPLTQFNFLTSRFFSAIDIELTNKPDILILTDISTAEQSMIDPFTEAIQIQGRFRNIFEDGKSYNSLTHITNIKVDLPIKTPKQLDREIEEFKITHHSLIVRKEEAVCDNRKSAINQELERISMRKLLDKDGNIDDFAVDNLYNEERVRDYYTDEEKLLQAYKDTGFFNPTIKKINRFYFQEAKFSIRGLPSNKAKVKHIISLLGKMKEREEIYGFRKWAVSEFEEADIVLDAYLKYGLDFFESYKYNFNKIKTEFAIRKSEEMRWEIHVIQEVHNSFKLGVKDDKNVFKNRVQEIYNTFGIVQKVKQTTIEDYFVVEKHNGEIPAKYTLVKCKW